MEYHVMNVIIDSIYLTYLYQPVRKIKKSNCNSSIHDVIVVFNWRHLAICLSHFRVFRYYLVFSIYMYKTQSWVWGWDEKYAPHDHQLPSLSKPRDVYLWSRDRFYDTILKQLPTIPKTPFFYTWNNNVKKLLHMPQSLFWYRSPKIVTKFTRYSHST